MDLTKTQLEALLENAYGFVDDYGSLMLFEKSLSYDNFFTLQNVEGELEYYSYDSAKLEAESATLTLQRDPENALEENEAVFEQFTVLVMAKPVDFLDLLKNADTH